jgi:rubrerythrin
MTDLNTVDEILNFAIDREQEAVDFYTGLAGKARSPAMQATFRQFAGEEAGHKAKLLGVKGGKRMVGSQAKVQDLKLADYVVDEQPGADLDYQGALILAMKKEKAAFRLYSDLAGKVDDGEIRGLLLGLAQEEAKHKLRFEVEYDENVLTEN